MVRNTRHHLRCSLLLGMSLFLIMGCGGASQAAPPSGTTPTPTGSAVQGPPAGFGTNPIFDEEFNGTSLNTSVWTYRGVGAQRDDCFIDPSAVSIANGYARISIYTANNAQGKPTNFCGALTTQSGSFLHSYGYYEASVRFQYQQGMQCAFWLQSPSQGAIINNPQQSGTEMDIFEHTHFTPNPIGYDHAIIWNGYGAYSRDVPHFSTQSNLNDGNFHTFGLAWTPGSLDFYVDGVKDWHLSASDAAISNIAEYLILDTELPNASVVPAAGYGPLGASTNAHLDVDYVRVYPYSTNTISTTLTPVADAYVRDGNSANTNFAGSSTLNVKSDVTGNNQNAYLKFDLSQITGTVLQATLYLTPVTTGQSKITNSANLVTDNSWTASGINWSNQPQTSGTMSTGISYAPNILTNFDATANAAAGKQFSIQIAPNSPTGSSTEVDYASQENGTTSYRPQLVVISSTP